MEAILKDKPWSIILASGTLTPFNALEEELGFKFQNKIACPHVIEQSQMMMRIVRTYNDMPFLFNYRERSNREMMFNLEKLLRIAMQIHLMMNVIGHFQLYDSLDLGTTV